MLKRRLSFTKLKCRPPFRCYTCSKTSSPESNNTGNVSSDQVIVSQKNDEVNRRSNYTSIDHFYSISKCDDRSVQDEVTENDFRKNGLNIQMLSRHLYNQLFSSVSTVPNDERRLIDNALVELRKHGLPGSLHRIPDVALNLPEIFNNDIEQHFYKIAEEQAGPYRELLNRLLGSIPQMPEQWSFTAGWTKYERDGKPTSIEYPEDDVLIFDVEVCCQEGELPTIATAVSTNSWYSWVNKELIKGKSRVGKKGNYSTDNLIPLEPDCVRTKGGKVDGLKKTDLLTDRPRIVVGHNVSYDRARIKEQYFLEKSSTRFMDTMSLHVSISGITSYQKALLKSGSSDDSDWMNESCLSSLSEIHKFYCGTSLEKEQRNIFVTGTYKDVLDNFQSLMTYCARDAQATHRIFLHLWPEFLTRFSHPVTLAGLLELGTCYLPVNDNWNRYVEDCQQSYDDLDIEGKLLLTQEADRACQLLHNETFKRDLWLWDQNWETKVLKLKKEKKKTTKSKTKKNDADQSIETADTSQTVVASPSCTIYNSDVDECSYFDAEKQIRMEENFRNLLNSTDRLPVKIPHLAGYPEWYRQLCSPVNDPEWKPGPHLISTSKKITPKLLNLTWKSMPLHHIRGHGWGYLVPYGTEIQLPEEERAVVPLKLLQNYYRVINGTSEKLEINANNMKDAQFHNELERSLMYSYYGCKKTRREKKTRKEPNDDEPNRSEMISFSNECGFVKLPHKNGDKLNVGNPLARDFIDKFTETGLGGENGKAAKIIEINRKLFYWKNNRERIENQFIVWLKKRDLPNSVKSSGKTYGAIVPKVIVCGTLTRRAVESTWMTASNAVDERVGSELRCMVQAPDGYSLVGADVDSQELWIASLIGDAYFGKEHGCTPFGWMTISGDKADQTDMHSVTAKTMGISRSNAKIINYARIYGAGQYFAERLLKQFIPDLSASIAKDRASKMFRKTKGYRIFQLKSDCLPEQEQRQFYRNVVKELCSLHGKNVDDLFHKPKWIGGSESAMFNRLEEIANSHDPVTPFLHCRLSKALQPSLKDTDKFLPTRINWVVQSGAVDFLHLMLVCMRWLVHPKVRFSLSFHDEVHYLTPQKYKYQTALALHVTNLLTRAFCVRRLGMVDLPQSVAFFSSVEVDTVLRKDASSDCRTPSNPHGLTNRYGISLGESLNIHEAIKRANGVIGIHNPDVRAAMKKKTE